MAFFQTSTVAPPTSCHLMGIFLATQLITVYVTLKSLYSTIGFMLRVWSNEESLVAIWTWTGNFGSRRRGSSIRIMLELDLLPFSFCRHHSLLIFSVLQQARLHHLVISPFLRRGSRLSNGTRLGFHNGLIR